MARFIDRVTLHVSAGDGGHGCNSIRREKFVPLGGPDGGNGGHGGDVKLIVDHQVHTLLDFHYSPHVKAQKGEPGQGGNKHGARGEDLILKVPNGTVVTTADGELIADLIGEGTELTVARGGRGGLGNASLVSRTRRAPGFALLGEPGETCDVILELKSVADVGLVGYPSAGKSSLISVLSAAKPKIADYPFTTLQPNLGVVTAGDTTYTMADVPGLIPGAAEGRGLGLDFLRHIERTAVLVHVVDCATLEAQRDPVSDVDTLEAELDAYQPALETDTGLGDLKDRPRIVVLNKIDVPEARELAEFIKPEFENRGWPVYLVSAVTREGLNELSFALAATVEKYRKNNPVEETRRVIIRPQAQYADEFTVEPDPRLDNAYTVKGAKPELWIKQTVFDNDEAVGYLADRLAKLGVEEALFEAGARPNCTVTIGDVCFDWDPDTLAGVDETPTARGTDARLDTSTRVSAKERRHAKRIRHGLADEDSDMYDESTW